MSLVGACVGSGARQAKRERPVELPVPQAQVPEVFSSWLAEQGVQDPCPHQCAALAVFSENNFATFVLLEIPIRRCPVLIKPY